MLDCSLPGDMPMATNTKMLFSAYYLYNGIIDKANVANEFVNTYEKNIFEKVKTHIIDNCQQLRRTSPDRKIELGRIVFEKTCTRLQKDVESYSDTI